MIEDLIIYDVLEKDFKKKDPVFKLKLRNSAIIKGIKAILSNNFPEDISVRA